MLTYITVITAYKLYSVQSAVFLIRFNTLFMSNCLFYYKYIAQCITKVNNFEQLSQFYTIIVGSTLENHNKLFELIPVPNAVMYK